MSNLSKQKPTFDLKKYLHDVYELEKQKYLLEKRVDILETQQEDKDWEYQQHLKYDLPNFQNTDFYRQYCNEFKQYENPMIQPNIPKEDKMTGKLVGIFAIIAFVIGAITACSASFIRPSSDNVVWPLLVFPIIGAIAGAIIGSTIDAKNEEAYNQRIKGYEEANNKIQTENKKKETYNNQRYYYWQSKFNEDENQKKSLWEIQKLTHTEYIKKETALIKTELQKLDSVLDSIYSLEIDGKLCLHPAYRGLSSVAVIYGYLDTGRCTELEGHEGAYNIYEQEKRLGYIIDKLDVISNKLDRLNGTMMYLGQAIYQCNDKLDQLNENSMKTLQAIEYMDMDISAGMSQLAKGMDNVSGNLSGISQTLSNIEVNSANSAYYAEIGSEAATFSAYYDMFKN